MADDMQDFAAEARAFLDAHAAKAPDRTAPTWGEGDDSVAYFSSLRPRRNGSTYSGRATGSASATRTASAGSPARWNTAAGA